MRYAIYINTLGRTRKVLGVVQTYATVADAVRVLEALGYVNTTDATVKNSAYVVEV